MYNAICSLAISGSACALFKFLSRKETKKCHAIN